VTGKSGSARVAALASQYVENGGSPAVHLGDATIYLSIALERHGRCEDGHFGEWAIGAAAFATAAAASTGRASVEDIVERASAMTSEPGFDGDGESDAFGWAVAAFGRLGRATTSGDSERIDDEATLAVAMILRMIELFPDGPQR
jgi:hypothetical protein